MIKSYTQKMVVVNLLLLLAFYSEAQINNPVFWSYTAIKTADKTYDLHVTATITANWKLYGQSAGTGFEPTTTFTFTKNPLISYNGNVKEVGKMEKYFDKNFKSELIYYTNKVDFIQKIKVKTALATVVKGTVNYVVCNNKSCLPPKNVPFTINISGK